jgi:hypothetical protein
MLARFLVVVLAALVILAACRGGLPAGSIVGSGRAATQTFDFSDFDKVELSDAFEAEIAASDDYMVEVTVDDNLVNHLQVEQRGNTVKIGLKPFTSVTNAHMHARILLPALASLSASGASRAGVTGFRSGKNMQFNASGASEIRGDMETGDLTADASGGSTLRLTGRGSAIRANASGASTIDLRDFTGGDADVEASGASRIELNTSGTLNAKASGASTVHYAGDALLGQVDESGASTVSKR